MRRSCGVTGTVPLLLLALLVASASGLPVDKVASGHQRRLQAAGAPFPRPVASNSASGGSGFPRPATSPKTGALPAAPNAASSIVDLLRAPFTDAKAQQLLVYLGKNGWDLNWNTEVQPVSFFTGGVRSIWVQNTPRSKIMFTDKTRAEDFAGTFTPNAVRVKALVVPQVLATNTTVVKTAGGKYQVVKSAYQIMPTTGSDIQLIITPLFTGCTFMIGVLNGKTVKMVHLQPSTPPARGFDPLTMRSSLSQLMYDNGTFAGGPDSKTNIYTFGGNNLNGVNLAGYGTGTALAMGVVTSKGVLWLVRIENTVTGLRTVVVDTNKLS